MIYNLIHENFKIFTIYLKFNHEFINIYFMGITN